MEYPIFRKKKYIYIYTPQFQPMIVAIGASSFGSAVQRFATNDPRGTGQTWTRTSGLETTHRCKWAMKAV